MGPGGGQAASGNGKCQEHIPRGASQSSQPCHPRTPARGDTRPPEPRASLKPLSRCAVVTGKETSTARGHEHAGPARGESRPWGRCLPSALAWVHCSPRPHGSLLTEGETEPAGTTALALCPEVWRDWALDLAPPQIWLPYRLLAPHTGLHGLPSSPDACGTGDEVWDHVPAGRPIVCRGCEALGGQDRVSVCCCPGPQPSPPDILEQCTGWGWCTWGLGPDRTRSEATLGRRDVRMVPHLPHTQEGAPLAGAPCWSRLHRPRLLADPRASEDLWNSHRRGPWFPEAHPL